MNRAGWLVLMVMTACATQDPNDYSAEEAKVREAFEIWRDGFAEGRFDDIYDGMSLRMKNLWFWGMMQNEKDPVLKDQRTLLNEGQNRELDVWFARNGTRAENEVDLLPVELIATDWFRETIRKHFEVLKNDLAYQFQNVQIVQVAVDPSGATVLVSNIQQGREMYNCVFDGAGWKVDGHRGAMKTVQ